MIKSTETFYHGNEIFCITRNGVDKNGYVYGKYCTGKYDDGLEYAALAVELCNNKGENPINETNEKRQDAARDIKSIRDQLAELRNIRREHDTPNILKKWEAKQLTEIANIVKNAPGKPTADSLLVMAENALEHAEYLNSRAYSMPCGMQDHYVEIISDCETYAKFCKFQAELLTL